MDKRKKAASTTTHSLNKHDKGNEFQTQYQIVYQSFKEHPKTMLDVSLETGILRANICRYVADMEDKGLIQFLIRQRTNIRCLQPDITPQIRSCSTR